MLLLWLKEKEKTTDLSPFERRLIVSSCLAGVSISKTAGLTGFSKAAISKVFKSWNQNPQSFSRRRNCSSRTVFQERDRCHIRRIVRQNKDSTVVQLPQSSTKALPDRFQLEPCAENCRGQECIIECLWEHHSFLPITQKIVCSGVEKEDTRHLRIGNGWCGRMNHAIPYFALMKGVEFGENPTRSWIHLVWLALCKGLEGVSWYEACSAGMEVLFWCSSSPKNSPAIPRYTGRLCTPCNVAFLSW